MPKRARETEETQDSEWIGRAVMLTPATARGKRLPEAIVMKILRVTRGVGASKVLVEYDLNGAKKQYTDTFLSGTPLSERYVAVAAQAVPMDCERFMAAWSFEKVQQWCTHVQQKVGRGRRDPGQQLLRRQLLPAGTCIK